MRPFFSFFGGKWKLSAHYPPPRHDVVIEPFAGSAGYATRHHDRRVILVERDPIIAALWRYLIAVSADEILSLPLDVSDLASLPIAAEARHLIGFWISRCAAHPRKHATSWMASGRWPQSFWGAGIRARIANQVQGIRHWRVIEGDYSEAPNAPATWFVDPPYVKAGWHYRYHELDYAHLAGWVRARQGQVIACEQEGADWLPFEPFRNAKSIARGISREAIYVNEVRS